MAKEEDTSLQIRTLGRFEVLRNGIPIPEESWPRRRTKELLKVLLTAPGRFFTVDQLVDALLPTADVKTATHNIHARVSELRRVLEPDLARGNRSQYIVRKGQAYCFEVDSPCSIDVLQFEKLRALGQDHRSAGRHVEAIEAFEAAIDLYRGDSMEADRYEEWTLEARQHWREQYALVLTTLAEEHAHLGNTQEAAAVCREAFDLHPAREDTLRQLMEYYRTMGKRAEALRVYQIGTHALRSDLEAAPSSETEALHSEILNQSPPNRQLAFDKRRIVILPLVNISSDPEDEYFADGITEELIHTLSQIHDLRVIAQTSALSYKNTRKTMAQIGRELSIGSALEGSIRRADDTVRITVQLVDAASEEHLWSEEYDRSLRDIFAIQSDVAQQVARALRVRLADSTARRMAEAPTRNLEAYSLYLKGRSFLEQKKLAAIEKARDCFRRAIELDPDFAFAHAGLSDAYFHLVDYDFMDPEAGHPLSRAEAERAVEIDATCRTGLLLLACLLLTQDRDVLAAEKAFRHLLALHPGYASAHRVFGLIRMYRGDVDEAANEIRLAIQLDPLDLVAQRNYAEVLTAEGRYDEAMEVLQHVLEVDPQTSRVHLDLGACYYRKGMYEEALAELGRETAYPTPAHIGCVYAAMGKTDEARGVLDQLIERSETEHVNPVYVAQVAFAVGENELGFQYLEEAFGVSPRVLTLKTSPWFQSVRSDPRFIALLREAGLEPGE